MYVVGKEHGADFVAEQRATAESIFSAIVSVGGSDFDSAVFEVTMLEGTSEATVRLASRAGTISLRVPPQAREAARQLRADMATPDGGAWYFARFSFDRDGNYRAVFDYDSRPQWHLGLDPESEREMVLEDLEKFPRSEGAIPNWLREMLP